MFLGPWTYGALLLLVWVLGGREALLVANPDASPRQKCT